MEELAVRHPAPWEKEKQSIVVSVTPSVPVYTNTILDSKYIKIKYIALRWLQ
jgi:hypothetical protein